jgi:hypothetical protein
MLPQGGHFDAMNGRAAWVEMDPGEALKKVEAAWLVLQSHLSSEPTTAAARVACWLEETALPVVRSGRAELIGAAGVVMRALPRLIGQCERVRPPFPQFLVVIMAPLLGNMVVKSAVRLVSCTHACPVRLDSQIELPTRLPTGSIGSPSQRLRR